MPGNLFYNVPRPLFRKTREEIPGLNALKFLCAIMVVGIHIPFVLQPHLIAIYRIAVPIFFMISGYFLVNTEGVITTQRIKRVFIKVLILAITANVIYYIFKLIIFHRYTYPLFVTIIEGGTIAASLWYLNAYL